MKITTHTLLLLLVAPLVFAGCEPAKETVPAPSAGTATQDNNGAQGNGSPGRGTPGDRTAKAGTTKAGTAKPQSSPVAKVTPPAVKRPRKPQPSGGRLDGQNVLFVTLDTTRADRLGCYGYDKAATPAIDSIAARGVVFDRAFTQVPLTLPAHASMMTGRYPREHGIRNNNQAGLAEGFPTLASAFQERGYRTAAFVASFVIDSNFGLDRGFDVYEDDMTITDMVAQPAEWQQPANVVTDRALKWLKANEKESFFAWVHYYDPHDPYRPPAEYADRHEDPYDGEIAFVDDQLKRITDWLASSGLEDNTLVVIAGDHGESFGEHQEEGHAIFLYESNLHVPMIMAHPKLGTAERRVEAIVELVDLFPTILELFNWPAPAGLLSRSLVGAIDGKELDDVATYAESHHVKEAFDWAEQRSLTTARWKYISTTKPELYDRQKDPLEKRNIIELAPEVASGMLEALKDRYSEMTPGKATVVELSPAQLRALKSLGYAAGGNASDNGADDFLTPGLRDPKEMYVVLLQIRAGTQLIREGKYPEAVQILEHALVECPKATPVYSSLAIAYVESDQPELAEILLNDAIESKSVDAADYSVQVVLGDAVFRLNRPEEAIQHYRVAIGDDGPYADVHAKLAKALQKVGQKDEAITHYRRAIELYPKFPDAHFDLALLLSERGDLTGGMAHYETATEIFPEYAQAHYNLGMLLVQANRASEAVARMRKAIEIKPDFGDAMINLGIVLVQLGRTDEAKTVLTRAMEVPPVAAKAHYMLGVAYATEGKIDRTVELYEKALTLEPFDPSPVTELARYYLQNKKPADAVRVLGIGAMKAPDDVGILSLYAKVLATTVSDDLRNGTMALELIERADAITEGNRVGVRATLAAALAEVGRFEEAVIVASQTLARAEAANKTALADALKAQILLYRKNQPFRSADF